MMLPLVAICVCTCWLVLPAGGQRTWRQRDTTDTTTQHQFTGDRRTQRPFAETHQLWDPLLYNMFEVLISSMDDKFKRVDTIERAIHMVMRHMEIMDVHLQQNNNMTEKILTRVQRLEQQLGTPSRQATARAPASPAGGSRMERQLDAVQSRLQRMQTTLDSLETAASARVQVAPAPPVASMRSVHMKRGPARSRARTTQNVPSQFIKDTEKMVQAVNEVRGKVVAMDNKLSFHMDQMSENLSSIIKSVTAVSGVLLQTTHPNGTAGTSKLDVLVNKIQPLMEVSSKMDEVWNVVVGTQTSIDVLVPRSDELIHTTSRQERAINDIHTDLQERTKQIIDNLGMVEKRLNTQTLTLLPTRATAAATADDDDDDGKPGNRAGSSALGGGSRSTNTKRYIRPVAFPTRPTTATAPVSRSRLDKEAPFDLLDQQFLQAFQNYTEAPPTTTTAPTPVPRAAGSRGRPNGIVFPGLPPAATTNTSLPFLSTEEQTGNVGGYSCEEFREKGLNNSGIYYLRIHGTSFWYLRVYCNMEAAGGGWTVVQRRDNFGEAAPQSFNQPWENYKQGFGNPTRSFWLGNENIFMLTNTEDYQLRIELEDFEGETRYAQYRNFKMHGEKDNYKLEIGGYEGNAGDSMNDPWYGSNLSPFSTFDRDNDRSSLNCASMLKGGWWWRSCGRGLNGLYLTDPNDAIARQGIVWYRWRGWDYSLKRAVMMIRPNRPRQQSDDDAD